MTRYFNRLSPNLIFYTLALLVTGASTAVLLRFDAEYRRNLNGRLAEVRSALSSRQLLGGPGDARFSFSALESAVQRYESIPPIGRISVVKKINRARSGPESVIVHPFYATPFATWSTEVGWVYADSRKEVSGLNLPGEGGLPVHTFSLMDGDLLLGYLILELDASGLVTLRVVLAGLISLLTFSAFLFVRHLRKQERLISTKTIELDAKRRELVHLERLALAGHLSANLLHDLKKPILNIKNEIEDRNEAHESDGGTAQQMSVGTRIREQIDLFFGMLRDGGFDRFIRAGDDKEFVDVNELVQRSVALVKYERLNVTVQSNLMGELPSVFAQPVRLIQVFSNIILNAYQAMNGHGELFISSEIDSNMVIVSFRDTGPGIPTDAMDRLFEPFFSTKAPGKGTGLGLYIVKDIIEELGGSVAVESRPGETTFTVRLPGTA